MRNEETGNTIKCPNCGSKGDCKHLLAVIDQTFLECHGGYAFDRFNEFSQKIEKSFLTRLHATSEKLVRWDDDTINEIWSYAKKTYTKENEDWVDITGSDLFLLIDDLLFEAGGYEYPGSIGDEGGPGSSSSITLFYADNPESVFNNAIKSLSLRLKSTRNTT